MGMFKLASDIQVGETIIGEDVTMGTYHIGKVKEIRTFKGEFSPRFLIEENAQTHIVFFNSVA